MLLEREYARAGFIQRLVGGVLPKCWLSVLVVLIRDLVLWYRSMLMASGGGKRWFGLRFGWDISLSE